MEKLCPQSSWAHGYRIARSNGPYTRPPPGTNLVAFRRGYLAGRRLTALLARRARSNGGAMVAAR
jgi:hypothetical protein